MSKPNSLILQPGTSLGNGRYVLDRLLKQGRSSLTLQGTQVSNGKSLIFKFPLQDQGVLSTHQQRFQHIWQRVGHFQHPYLQQTVDYLEEQGIPCLVLEQISGRCLAQGLTTPTPLSEGTALRLIFQIAQGVQQLHDRGLIHGDLKPQNLIQHSQSKAIVVVDWGLFWQGWNSQLSPYSAPEPFMPPQLRASVDIYSLAACLYAFVTGHPPIAAAQQSTTPLVPPQSLIPGLSPMTQAAILQGMDLNPDRRPKSLQAWLTLLPQPYVPAQLPNVPAPPQNALGEIVPASPTSTAPRVGSPVQSSERSSRPEPLPLPAVARTAQTRVAVPRSPAKPSDTPVPIVPMPPTTSQAFPVRPLITSLWVIAIAGGVGLTMGSFLRWQQTQNSFAQSFFEKSQSFPAQEWPGSLDLEFPEDAPLPETDYAPQSDAPYLDWSPVAPVPQDYAAPPVDFAAPYQPESPIALPEGDPSGEGGTDASADTSVDPSQPLPNATSDSFEDPLYQPPEETAPAPMQEAPAVPAAEIPVDAPPVDAPPSP